MCSSSDLQSLFFKKIKLGKHLSSSTLPRTWTTSVFASITHFAIKWVRRKLAFIVIHNWAKGFTSKSHNIVALLLLFMAILNIPCCELTYQRSNKRHEVLHSIPYLHQLHLIIEIFQRYQGVSQKTPHTPFAYDTGVYNTQSTDCCGKRVSN